MSDHTKSATTELTDRERLLVTALRHAWDLLNTVRARDGVAYHRNDGMPYCVPEWWDEVTDMADMAITAATGDMPKPWPFKWELDEADSRMFIDAVLNAAKPNDVLKAAAERYKEHRRERESRWL